MVVSRSQPDDVIIKNGVGGSGLAARDHEEGGTNPRSGQLDVHTKAGGAVGKRPLCQSCVHAATGGSREKIRKVRPRP